MGVAGGAVGWSVEHTGTFSNSPWKVLKNVKQCLYEPWLMWHKAREAGLGLVSDTLAISGIGAVEWHCTSTVHYSIWMIMWTAGPETETANVPSNP